VTPDTTPRPSPAPRFAWYAAVSPVHDAAALRGLLDAYAASLRALGGERWDPATGTAAPPGGPPVIFVATGGTERLILERARFGPAEPALLVAHPGQNSLPAALEVLARLQQEGLRGRVHYLEGPADEEGLQALAGAVRDRAVRRGLREARIGLVGRPSDWLVASSPSPQVVREVWGPTVVPLPLDGLCEPVDADLTALGERIARGFRTGAAELVEPSEADLSAAGRVHAALRRMVDAGRIDAVSVRCFDLVARRRTTGCLALARLNEEGVIAGCEGDLVSTVTMLWAHRLLGALPWMANPSRVDRARGVLVLAHCTVPPSLTTGCRLRSHFESGLGVGIQGTLPEGPVTLVRIGGERLRELRAVDGLLVGNPDHPDLCRTQVEVEVGRAALDGLLARPLGNHVVLVAGHHAATLRGWHEAMIA
jgi:L-fucose isomerase-like protein